MELFAGSFAVIIILIPPVMVFDGVRRIICVKRAHEAPPNKKYLLIGSTVEIVFGVLLVMTDVYLLTAVKRTLERFI